MKGMKGNLMWNFTVKIDLHEFRLARLEIQGEICCLVLFVLLKGRIEMLLYDF